MKHKYSDLVKGISEAANDEVKVHCDEYHAHSALQGCLVGREEDIIICKLCEVIKILEYRLDRIVKAVEGE